MKHGKKATPAIALLIAEKAMGGEEKEDTKSEMLEEGKMYLNAVLDAEQGSEEHLLALCDLHRWQHMYEDYMMEMEDNSGEDY